jgi:hypothetical protein
MNGFTNSTKRQEDNALLMLINGKWQTKRPPYLSLVKIAQASSLFADFPHCPYLRLSQVRAKQHELLILQ